MRDEVRVGAFVVAAAAVLFALTLWILGRGVLGADGRHYDVLLPHAGGVVKGDRLRVAGVEAGRVEEVRLESGSPLPVRMRVVLEPAVTVRRGASATLRSDSLLGGNYLEIEPGASELPELEPGSEILGTERASMDQAFQALSRVAATAEETLVQMQQGMATLTSALEPAIARLEDTLSAENVESLRRFVDEGTAALRELRPELVRVLERADSLLVELEGATSEVPELVAAAREVAEDLSTALGEDGRALSELLESSRATLDSLDAGEGEISVLVRDLAATAANLRVLSDSLRERPSMLLGLRAPRERRPGQAADGGKGPP